jgi:hypothetical protein
MTKWMRYFVLVMFCLMSLAFAGPASAASDAGGCADSPTSVQNGSAAGTDCVGQNDMGQNKAHKCSHDAGCGYQLMAISEAGDFSALAVRRAAAVASLIKRLTASPRETLLDPPRA